MKKYILNIVTNQIKLVQLVTNANSEEEAKHNFLEKIRIIAIQYDEELYSNVTTLDEMITLLYEEEIIAYCDDCQLLEDHFNEISDGSDLDSLFFVIVFEDGIQYYTASSQDCIDVKNLLNSLQRDHILLSTVYYFYDYKIELLENQ